MRRLSLLFIVMCLSACPSSNNSKADPPTEETPTTSEETTNTETEQTEDAPVADAKFGVFAGGCFWCTEKDFEKIPGVIDAISGFSGGPEQNPTYKQVAGGKTGHTEVVKVLYDPNKVTYRELVDAFWMTMDPTDLGGQFVDRGTQYRPEIFYVDDEQKADAEASKQALIDSKRFSKPIVVPITKFDAFWEAEEYHQDFYKKSVMRYTSYRNGSGRDAFIQKHWKEK